MRLTRFIVLSAFLLFWSMESPAWGGVEITPSVGYRFGGAFEDGQTGTGIEPDESGGYHLAFDFDLDRERQIELYLSRQETTLSATGTFTGDPLFDVVIDYYQIGGLYLFEGFEGGKVRPFLSGTVGLARLDPEPGGLKTETRPSLSLGGGIKWFVTERIGLRLDARGIYTALNSNTEVFCAGGCAIRVQSDGFLQGEAGVGIVFRFESFRGKVLE